MGHTYTNLLTHIIFSTKDRLPYLQEARRNDVFAYLGGIVRELKGTALNIDGTADHVHALVRLPAALAVAKAVEIIKANSSRWIHEHRVLHRTFAWQTGYAAFSVSESNVDDVSGYISHQQEHHRKVTFQEELIAFLKRSRIEYDERYLWK
jgi:REP element-mobilizing transposase RayT